MFILRVFRKLVFMDWKFWSFCSLLFCMYSTIIGRPTMSRKNKYFILFNPFTLNSKDLKIAFIVRNIPAFFFFINSRKIYWLYCYKAFFLSFSQCSIITCGCLQLKKKITCVLKCCCFLACPTQKLSLSRSETVQIKEVYCICSYSPCSKTTELERQGGEQLNSIFPGQAKYV